MSDVSAVIKNLGWEPMSSLRQKALYELMRTAEIMTIEQGESVWQSTAGADSAYVLIEGNLELTFTRLETTVSGWGAVRQAVGSNGVTSTSHGCFAVLPVLASWSKKVQTGLAKTKGALIELDVILREMWNEPGQPAGG